MCQRMLVLAVLVAATACRRTPPQVSATPDANQVIATFTGGQFTRAEIAPLVANRLAHRAGSTSEADVLRSVLERRVRVQLLYADALEQGLADKPAVRLVLQALERRLLGEDWLLTHVTPGVTASAAQIEAEVQRRAQIQQPEEQRRFSHIFLRAPESDAAARAKARATMATIQRQLADGQAFDELARKYSDSITSRGGGQVEWTAKGPLNDALADAVFSMLEGQIGEPLETRTGLHLFRLDGIRRPKPADTEGLRAQVKTELDAEAARAAVAAERARVFDTSAVQLDPQQLARPGRKDQVLAQIAGQALTRQDYDTLRAALDPRAAETPSDFMKHLVVDTLLAQKQREQALSPALEGRLQDLRLGYLSGLRREALIATIPQAVSAQAVASYYEKNKDSAPFLRDHVIDLVFFAQSGASPGPVYEQGEAVSRRLRAGEHFEVILESLQRQPGVTVRRALSAGDLVTLRAQSGSLAKLLGRLAPGEVSTPVYMDGESVSFTQKTAVVHGKGVLFVRLGATRPLPLETVRARIADALRQEQEAAGITEIQRQLNERGNLKVLVASL